MLIADAAPASAEVIAMPARRLTIQTIKRAVADAYGLTCADLDGQNKTRSIAWPRMEAMWLCRRHTDFSLPQIARAFGGRDHTTALNAQRATEKRLAEGRLTKRADGALDAAGLDALVIHRQAIPNPIAQELAACVAVGQFIASTDFTGCFFSSPWAAWQARNRTRTGLATMVAANAA